MKKIIGFFAITVLLISCDERKSINQTSNSVEESYFSDSKINAFKKKDFTKHFNLLRLNITDPLNSVDTLYRMVTIPSRYTYCFSISYAINGDSAEIEYRLFNESSDLLTTSTLERTKYDSINYFVSNANLWSLNDSLTQCDGTDGTYFIFEAISKVNHNVVTKWSPRHCKTAYSDEFMSLFDEMRNMVSEMPLNGATLGY